MAFPFVFVTHSVGDPVPSPFFLTVAKTHNPSIPDSRFKEFSFLSLDDFVDGDRD